LTDDDVHVVRLLERDDLNVDSHAEPPSTPSA
jgi:hypothetical protein